LAPHAPEPYWYCQSSILMGDSTVKVELYSTPMPCCALPDFVVIKITPLAARDPYKAAAVPPFRTEMLSMSSGLMLVRPSPISRPPYVPGVPWLALLIG